MKGSLKQIDKNNEQKNIGEELIEQIHKNETALIQLSKQLDAYCESIQEVKKQFDKLTNQYCLNS